MKTLEEIQKIREEKRKELDLRVNLQSNTTEKHILVCHGTGCTSSKSPKIIENFRRILEEKGITNVRVIQTGCFGLCSKGPIVIIRPEDTFYSLVAPEDCEEIINTHIVEGKPVERLKEKLGIDVGQTTSDGKFSIEATRCIGACGLAPVFTVNDEVYGKATPELLDKVIDEYKAKEE